MFPVFIGYEDLEVLLSGLQPTTVVYLMLMEEPVSSNGPSPVGLNRLLLSAQAITPQGVRYWRVNLGGVQTIAGHPADERQHNSVWERARSAYQIVREWLIKNGYTVEEAAVAMPRDYRLLIGALPAWLRYDKAADRFAFEPAQPD